MKLMKVGGWLARPNAIWQDQYYYMSFKHTVPRRIVTYLLTYPLANSMHKLCVRMCENTETWIPYPKVVSVSPLPDDATTGIVHCDASS